jgi:hypothetical protein
VIVLGDDVAGCLLLLGYCDLDEWEIVGGYLLDFLLSEHEFGLHFECRQRVELLENVWLALGFELREKGMNGCIVPEEVIVEIGDFEGFD